MGKPARLAQEQARALARLSGVPGIDRFYLAGGSAVGWHLGHRLSNDLDLFSRSGDVDLDELRERILAAVPGAEVVSRSDVTMKLRVEAVPVDVVRYRYAPLDAPPPGPDGFPIASLRDLAAMKLATIAGRGLRRDFWDLHEILQAGLTLAEAADAYLRRFGSAQSDLYHVLRALTYFVDAEADPVLPAGLTTKKWEAIKAFFRAEAPKLTMGSG